MLIIPMTIEDECPSGIRKLNSLSDFYYFLAQKTSTNDAEQIIIVRDDLIGLFPSNEIKIDVCKYNFTGDEVLLGIEPSAYVNFITNEQMKQQILDSKNSAISETNNNTQHKSEQELKTESLALSVDLEDYGRHD